MYTKEHEKLDAIFLRQFIEKVLVSLGERYLKVYRLRFGEELSMKECGEILKITGSRISQMEMKGFRKVRQALEAHIDRLEIPWVKKKILEEIDKEKEKEKARQNQMKEFEIERQKRWEEINKRNERRSKLIIYNKPIVFPGTILDHYCHSNKPNYWVFDRSITVSLLKTENGPILHVPAWIGVIERSIDPECYDEWLDEMIKDTQE